jgi:hypothetical protein
VAEDHGKITNWFLCSSVEKDWPIHKGGARGSDEVYKIVDNSSWRVVIEDSDGNKQARLYHELIPASSDGAKKSAIAAERNKLKQEQKFVKLQRESGLDVDDRGAVIIPESLATIRSKRERKAPGYLRDFQT